MTEDDEIMLHKQLDDLFAILEAKTREERLEYFKRAFLTDFLTEDGDTTYIIRTHFSDKATESFQEKVERLVSNL